MKNTDIIAEVLKISDVKVFFAVTGGAVVHVIDSLINAGEMKPIFHHHEQAAALAADAYARVRGLGVCVVTTGPGVTNAITGLLCSWQDSVPTVFISGQARFSLTAQGKNLRQVGTQHLEVIPIVQNLTKKAVMLKPGDDVAEVLADLINIAQSGRKGPVWLDIPLDLQIQEFDFSFHDVLLYRSTGKSHEILEHQNFYSHIKNSESPVMLLGRGLNKIKQQEFSEIIRKLSLPCLRTWGFFDTNLVIPKEFDFGAVGVSGQRGANKIISEADLVISLGARWGQAVVGPAIEQFAPKAQIHLFDIDSNELDRARDYLPNVTTYLEDATEMLRKLNENCINSKIDPDWALYCEKMRTFNIEQLENLKSGVIDQYDVFSKLNELARKESIVVVDGGGTVVYCSMQIMEPLLGRKIIIPSASAPMGTGIPQAIGAQTAEPNSQVILVCGDGSFPFNMQELQSISTNQLPIKIIIFNNGGYLSIQGTQNQFLEGRHFGSASSGGLDIPDFRKIAAAFDFKYWEIEDKQILDDNLDMFLSSFDSAILEIKVQLEQEIFPRTGFKKTADGKFSPLPLSEMHPEKILPGFSRLI